MLVMCPTSPPMPTMRSTVSSPDPTPQKGVGLARSIRIDSNFTESSVVLAICDGADSAGSSDPIDLMMTTSCMLHCRR